MKTHVIPHGLRIALAGLMAFAIAGCDRPGKVAGVPQPGAAAAVEVSDATLTTAVKTALLREEVLKSVDITVVAAKGDVRLTGLVDTQGQIDRAITVARGIEGVHSIHDELTVKK
jgi:hyperosmotically inducible protein